MFCPAGPVYFIPWLHKGVKDDRGNFHGLKLVSAVALIHTRFLALCLQKNIYVSYSLPRSLSSFIIWLFKILYSDWLTSSPYKNLYPYRGPILPYLDQCPGCSLSCGKFRISYKVQTEKIFFSQGVRRFSLNTLRTELRNPWLGDISCSKMHAKGINKRENTATSIFWIQQTI